MEQLLHEGYFETESSVSLSLSSPGLDKQGIPSSHTSFVEKRIFGRLGILFAQTPYKRVESVGYCCRKAGAYSCQVSFVAETGVM